MSKISFVIHLGNHWRMFANAREDMTFLGTIQHSVAAIGALARTPDGHYVQVNGDVVAVLHAKKIEGALRKRSAKTQKSQHANHPSGDRLVADPPQGPRPILAPNHSPRASVCAPVVTVKKRRVAVRATTYACAPPPSIGSADIPSFAINVFASTSRARPTSTINRKNS